MKQTNTRIIVVSCIDFWKKLNLDIIWWVVHGSSTDEVHGLKLNEPIVELWWMIWILLFTCIVIMNFLILFEVHIEIKRQLIVNKFIHKRCSLVFINIKYTILTWLYLLNSNNSATLVCYDIHLKYTTYDIRSFMSSYFTLHLLFRHSDLSIKNVYSIWKYECIV